MSRSLILSLGLAGLLVGCNTSDSCDDESEVAIADLPAAVTDALEAEYPDSTLLEAELEDDADGDAADAAAPPLPPLREEDEEGGEDPPQQ